MPMQHRHWPNAGETWIVYREILDLSWNCCQCLSDCSPALQQQTDHEKVMIGRKWPRIIVVNEGGLILEAVHTNEESISHQIGHILILKQARWDFIRQSGQRTSKLWPWSFAVLNVVVQC